METMLSDHLFLDVRRRDVTAHGHFDSWEIFFLDRFTPDRGCDQRVL